MVTARAHVTAVLTLLDAVPNLTTYDGLVPARPVLPYAVVWPDSGRAERSSILAASNVVASEMYVTCVGSSREQAQWVAEKVDAALLDVRPTITGRSCWPIEQVLTRPVQRDDDVDPPLVYAVNVYRLASIPA